MKKKIKNLQEEYKKSLSDSSSKIFKLIKLEEFKSLKKELSSQNKDEVKKILLNPDNDADAKFVSEVLFRVVLKEDYAKIANNMSYDDFMNYKEDHYNNTYTDYFFDVANHTLEKEIMGNNSVEENSDFCNN